MKKIFFQCGYEVLSNWFHWRLELLSYDGDGARWSLRLPDAWHVRRSGNVQRLNAGNTSRWLRLMWPKSNPSSVSPWASTNSTCLHELRPGLVTCIHTRVIYKNAMHIYTERVRARSTRTFFSRTRVQLSLLYHCFALYTWYNVIV